MNTSHSTPVILSIAGSDSSAGAGIAADIKTGGVFGVHVCTAITTVTAQNPQTVRGLYPLPASLVIDQISAVTEAFAVKAIKLGLLGNSAILEAVCEHILAIDCPIVADPVMVASSGRTLLNEDLVSLYREKVLPHATVLTPNLHEAASLLNSNPAKTYEDMEQQARALLALGPTAVLLKGGHLIGEHSNHDHAADCLATAEAITPFSARRVNTTAGHGSGCSLATAVAAGLAQGLNITQAVAAAKSFMNGAFANSDRLNLATTNGPLHQFYTYW